MTTTFGLRSLSTRLLVAAGIALTASAAIFVQNVRAEQPVAQQSLHEMVEELAGSLERYFLDPAAGRIYARELRRRLVSGRYRGLAPDALARTVTADLQKLRADGHLRISPPSRQPMLGAPSAAKAEQESVETGIENPGGSPMASPISGSSCSRAPRRRLPRFGRSWRNTLRRAS
jgi:hypothetical protein